DQRPQRHVGLARVGVLGAEGEDLLDRRGVGEDDPGLAEHLRREDVAAAASTGGEGALRVEAVADGLPPAWLAQGVRRHRRRRRRRSRIRRDLGHPQILWEARAMSDSRARSAFRGRTAWTRSLQAPLREFLATEMGSAAVLAAAAVAALVWANVDLSSYESVWRTRLSIEVGGSGISQDLPHLVNSGLMTFFFCVIGLEVRREFDVGELRERRRLALPVLAALGGMAVPIAIYLAINGGHGTEHGWGVAMSTDTAFALAMLALVGPR